MYKIEMGCLRYGKTEVRTAILHIGNAGLINAWAGRLLASDRKHHNANQQQYSHINLPKGEIAVR